MYVLRRSSTIVRTSPVAVSATHDVEAMHVAAEASEVQLVRSVVQPFLRPRRRLRATRATAAATPRARDRALRLGGDVDRLILEALRLDLDAGFGFEVEDVNL